MLVALVGLLVVWDDARHVEPWALLSAPLASSFAFGLVWRYYPEAGAVLTLAGVAVALALPGAGRSGVPTPGLARAEWLSSGFSSRPTTP